ncbi:MAG: chemotaxis response regulator protein-glutamate methylesterase, partial [Comamonas sp.]|jgi:two-component system chemotaxis response regulator CheB|uniref:protein-glutamate methylesterase/protein-glutamine glutaminase n=1 Tax=Comamonas sp. TaxID=34028 RepID=UPI002835BBC6
MISTLTERGAEVTMRALELGAVDFVAKPRVGVANGLQELANQIVDKIRVAAVAQVHRAVPAASTASSAAAKGAAPVSSATLLGRLSTEKIIAIGASTGGTEAIKEVLVQMPADAPAIVITQHMPPGFTTSFAARLNGLCQITVKEAVNGERILPGHAYIAPGGKQFAIARSGANYVAVVNDDPPVNRHKPSVEVLFKSVAACVARNAYGVMLTGMGADGAVAMREMKDAGSYNYVQDEASCIVFGMPREAIAHGAADEVLPLTQIAPALLGKLRTAPDHVRHRI